MAVILKLSNRVGDWIMATAGAVGLSKVVADSSKKQNQKIMIQAVVTLWSQLLKN